MCLLHAYTPTRITPIAIKLIPKIRMRSSCSLKISRPAMTIDTILIAPSKTPCESESTDKKANQTTNSRQKQTIPTQSGIDLNMDFQRFNSEAYSWSTVAAHFNATWPTVSKVTFNTQIKIAIEVNWLGFRFVEGGRWCRMSESNWRPSHYKCAALPTELIRRIWIYCF